MKLRTWYLDEHGKTRSFDGEIPAGDLQQHLAEVGRILGSGGLMSFNQDGKHAFSIPASRILKIESRS